MAEELSAAERQGGVEDGANPEDAVTTGAAGDFEQVTRVAHMMVAQLGFSDKIGQVNVGGADGQTFLGQEVGRTVSHSNHTAGVVESETRRIVLRAYRRAKDLLQHNMGLLHKVTDSHAARGALRLLC